MTLRYKPSAEALEGLPLGAAYDVHASGMVSDGDLQVGLSGTPHRMAPRKRHAAAVCH